MTELWLKLKNILVERQIIFSGYFKYFSQAGKTFDEDDPHQVTNSYIIIVGLKNKTCEILSHMLLAMRVLMIYHIRQVTLDREEQWHQVKGSGVQRGKSRVKEQEEEMVQNSGKKKIGYKSKIVICLLHTSSQLPEECWKKLEGKHWP